MKSEVGSRNSELGSRNSELGSRNSELGSRKLEVGTKKSEIRSPYPAFVVYRHFSLLNVNVAGACGYDFRCDGGRLVRAYLRR